MCSIIILLLNNDSYCDHFHYPLSFRSCSGHLLTTSTGFNAVSGCCLKVIVIVDQRRLTVRALVYGDNLTKFCITSILLFCCVDRYFDDFRPVLPGCSCYCCTNHTRAYINHLFNTKELLARVLLTM